MDCRNQRVSTSAVGPARPTGCSLSPRFARCLRERMLLAPLPVLSACNAEVSRRVLGDQVRAEQSSGHPKVATASRAGLAGPHRVGVPGPRAPRSGCVASSEGSEAALARGSDTKRSLA